MKILTEPRNALVKQYRKLLEMDRVDLEITEDAIEAIAEQALARKTGARGLRGIMERIMTNIMFELPSRTDVAGCRITRQTVEQQEDPELILRAPELVEQEEQPQLPEAKTETA